MRWQYMTKEEKFLDKVERECRWHSWFAWYPVTVVYGGTHYRVWLERVGRRKKLATCHGDYEVYDGVRNGEFCFHEDLLFNKIKDDSILDTRR